uniref:Uncharacterized protein n=1 Tax=Anguilla anguilla TaxID=7936 RepID=A0A0E9W5X3_ANGAN
MLASSFCSALLCSTSELKRSISQHRSDKINATFKQKEKW